MELLSGRIHGVPTRRGIRRIRREGLTRNAETGLSDALELARLLSIASAPILESITDG